MGIPMGIPMEFTHDSHGIVVRSASAPEPEPHRFEAGSKSAPVYNCCWPGGDGSKWMCPIARSRGDIYNEHVKLKK